ncbi:TPA: hypothetical protein OMI13_002557 [Escherichia coli]|uniref:hypothetical protein n=1 Tax=Escherichia coli TaxID=562 RepID=UPI000BE45852|nr:hypothetical protein [Escherichia coli]EFM1910218.1 hypothetical protein [Escherichia coli]VED17997.1 Uncharacterised protein [Escherichia coli]HAH9834900.1 hypothetical protein [Escherichia coli]HAI2217847.1 hypothetical protein [Escherichia coli]HCQ8898040.1 hypothetical protein [Escherichia coli]
MRNENLYLIDTIKRRIYDFDSYKNEFNKKKTLISLDSNCCTDLLCNYWSSRFAKLYGYEMCANYSALEGNSSSFDDETQKYIRYCYITKAKLESYGYNFQRQEFTKSFLDAFNHPATDIHNSGTQFLRRVYEIEDLNLKVIIDNFLSFGPVTKSKQHLINPFLVHTALFYSYRNKANIKDTPATFLKKQQYDNPKKKTKDQIAYNVYMDCYILFHTFHLPVQMSNVIRTTPMRLEPYMSLPIATFDKGMMLFAKAFFTLYNIFDKNYFEIRNNLEPIFVKKDIINKLSEEDISTLRSECYPSADDECIKEIVYELLVNRLVF